MFVFWGSGVWCEFRFSYCKLTDNGLVILFVLISIILFVDSDDIVV